MCLGNHHLWWLGCTVGLEGLSMDDQAKAGEWIGKHLFAFPTPVHNLQNDGMTLRDYFAAHAMQGVFPLCQTHEIAAKECYKVADAMIKERTK
jgi:hypothetical protein